jgi:hypothetical protein
LHHNAIEEHRRKEAFMAHDPHIYGEVNSETGLRRVFREIRHDVDGAKARPGLTELYKRAGYLITLTHAPSWEVRWGTKAKRLRGVAKKEFATTARKINRRARQVGADPDYDEKWGR